MSSKTKTTATKEAATPALVPKLRFPAFKNAGAWENKTLSACLDYQQPTPYLVADTNYRPAFKTPVVVLISRDAGIGKSAVMSIPMAVSQHFIAWTCKPRLLSNWFLYHLLQNSKPLFERAATGSTIKTIGLQFFIDLVFRLPLLPEQQRIADCLTSLDELIAAQTHKLDALKTHKKGLMQQLFPAPEAVEA